MTIGNQIERTGRHATTASWQNVGTLADVGSKVLVNAILSVPASAAEAVLFSISVSEPGSDAVANTIGVDGSRYITRAPLDQLWIKSASASTFEWCGILEG